MRSFRTCSAFIKTQYTKCFDGKNKSHPLKPDIIWKAINCTKGGQKGNWIRNQSIPHKPDFVKLTYLIGGLEHLHCFPFHIWDVILPIDWRTHIFQDGWNHQPVIEPRKMEDVSCNLAILNMPYIYGRYLQSIGSCCMAIDGKPMVSVLENDRQMAVTACCKCGVVAPWSWPNMCKSCIEPLKILELEFTIFMFWLLSVVPFDTCLFSFFHVDILWDCKNYHFL